MTTDASGVRRKPVQDTQSWAMEFDPHRLPLLREVVTAQMRLWELEERVEDARLIATELVCNIKHTGDNHFRLIMRRRTDAIVIGVRDFSPVLVAFPDTEPDVADLDLRELAEHGRGLSCVRSFADGVGVRPVPNGKVIWAKLRYPHACQA
ncbi:ATP-binding protein [Streptomyces sp. NPDC050610]|uniref:ATP-binding protein n=1 Tax=Streptomyces sp. NPDC050610 TaxID=3157097 RepID=UPI003436C767